MCPHSSGLLSKLLCLLFLKVCLLSEGDIEMKRRNNVLKFIYIYPYICKRLTEAFRADEDLTGTGDLEEKNTVRR